MVVHDVSDGSLALLLPTSFRRGRFQRWRSTYPQPCPTTGDPDEVADLSDAFADNVDQVLEQLIIAASWLREAIQRAGVGPEAHSLLLHKLTLPLLGLRELRRYDN